MGFRGPYRRLEQGGEAAARPKRRCRWLRKGKAMLFRLPSPSKRLKWMRSSAAVIPARVSELYSGVLSTMRVDCAVFPTINLSSQWGLPVLSHPPVESRKRLQVASLHKKPSLD